MKITILFLALISSELAISQEPEPSKYNLYTTNLCIGDTMVLRDIGIKFKKVISDSRCPNVEGITCIWAGEVTVLIEFYEDGEYKGEKTVVGTNILGGDTEIIYNTSISLSEFFDAEDIKLASVVVKPYPEEIKKISIDEYSLDLSIAEKVNKD